MVYDNHYIVRAVGKYESEDVFIRILKVYSKFFEKILNESFYDDDWKKQLKWWWCHNLSEYKHVSLHISYQIVSATSILLTPYSTPLLVLLGLSYECFLSVRSFSLMSPSYPSSVQSILTSLDKIISITAGSR